MFGILIFSPGAIFISFFCSPVFSLQRIVIFALIGREKVKKVMLLKCLDFIENYKACGVLA